MKKMIKEYINNDVKLTKKELITIICLLIVITGVTGWLYEVIFYYFNGGMKTFYMRSDNFLPWINIYTYGAFLVLFLTYKRRKHPIQVFTISVVATSIFEYLSGYILYGVLHWTKWWDYNKEILNFGNIDGYVCLRSMLVFGLLSLALIYLIVPLLLKLVKSKKINQDRLYLFSIIICSIILLDEIYNLIFPKILKIPGALDVYTSLGIKYISF